MLETRHLFVTLAASGEVVPAQAGKRIQVLAYTVMALTANNVKFQTGSGADISLTMYLAATAGLVSAFTEYGHFETLRSEALNVNLTAATAVSVEVIYVLV